MNKKTVVALFIFVNLLGCGKSTDPAPKVASEATQSTAVEKEKIVEQGAKEKSEAKTKDATKTWTAAPEMSIDQAKQYTAIVETSKGKFTIELYAKYTPIAVNNFVFLSKEHFYDGIVFHRIIKTFMIQTGDPQGNIVDKNLDFSQLGTGGPGYNIQDEENGPHSYQEGIVAMAKSMEPNSAGSQFFIGTGKDVESLNQDPKYTIIGQVTEGLDVVKKIAETPVSQNPYSGEPSQPTENVWIKSIQIEEK